MRSAFFVLVAALHIKCSISKKFLNSWACFVDLKETYHRFPRERLRRVMQEYGVYMNTSTFFWLSCHCIPGLIKSLAIFCVCYFVYDNGARISICRRQSRPVAVALDTKHMICKVSYSCQLLSTHN